MTILFVLPLASASTLDNEKLLLEFPEYADCGFSSCTIEGTLTNQYTLPITIISNDIKAVNPKISNINSFKLDYIQRNINVEYLEEKEFVCKGNLIEKEGLNGTKLFTCESESKEALFDKPYESVDTKTGTFVYYEKSIEQKQITDKIQEKGEFVIPASNSQIVKINFDVPKNSNGKFDIIIDYSISGKEYKAILDPWWNNTYPYRQQINISNTGRKKTDYQVLIDLNSTLVGGNFNWTNNGSDVIFTNQYNNVSLDFYIYSWDDVGEEASIWVEVDTLSASSTTPIYMYYGNMGASSASNGKATFDLFDDFSGVALNATLWDEETGTVALASGEMTFDTGDKLNSIPDFGLNYSVVARWKKTAIGTYGAVGAGFNWAQAPVADDDYSYMRVYNQNAVYQALGKKAGTAVITDTSVAKDTNVYHVFECIRNNSYSDIYYIDGSLEVTTTDTTKIPIVDMNVTFSVRYGDPQYTGRGVADWVFVRKYEYPEPTILELGAEEESPSFSMDWNWTNINSTITLDNDYICVNGSDNMNCTLDFNGTKYINTTTGINICWNITNLTENNYTNIYATCESGDSILNTSFAWLDVDLPENSSITYFYPKVVCTNQTFTIWAKQKYNGSIINDSNVTVRFDSLYNLTFNENNNRYSNTFSVNAEDNITYNISIENPDYIDRYIEAYTEVRDCFNLSVKIWQETPTKILAENENVAVFVKNYDVELNNPYLNEFAYIMAVNLDINDSDLYRRCNVAFASGQSFLGILNLGDFFGQEFTDALTDINEDILLCNRYWFRGEYLNGMANISLPYTGNYSLWLIAGALGFENPYAPPTIIKGFLTLPLGDIYIQSKEDYLAEFYITQSELNVFTTITGEYFIMLLIGIPLIISILMIFLGAGLRNSLAFGLMAFTAIIFIKMVGLI